ncbi:MAG: ATP-dependent Clp protease ATP-binding subunit ClpX [Lachnospiraceae bacterium]|nr:ATP-dependent Clp protease ATP-binding subunit ClpX [Lachnospiraceae bacterium]
MSDEKRFCYMCHRSEDEVSGRLIQIAPELCVCSECMQKTFDAMGIFSGGKGAAAGPVKEDTAKENAEKPLEGSVEGADAPESTEEKKQQTGGFDFSKIPGLQFINLSDLPNFASMGFPGFGQVNKPKKKKGKKAGEAKEGEERFPAIDITNIPPPHEIKALLDEHVVGQEYAKKVMSVAVYNHYKRVIDSENLLESEDDGVEIEKSNMLMIGPTGSGKTYMVKTIAKLLDVPLAITDATSLTEAGYIGDDIESVVSKLLAAADNDVEKAERGIIFIDEIDKLAKKKNTSQRDVSGESVQQGMLKLLEGAEVEVPVGASSKNAMVPMTLIDTSNILFICGGAFPDLEDVIKERLNKSSSMGFVADLKDKYDEDENILSKVIPEDLRKFGMIPEFIGRLPVIFALEKLSEEMFVRILTEPKNAIVKQYQKLLLFDEVKLEFEEDALYAIAHAARERELGARALRSIIEEFMLDIMYEIPKDDNIGTVIITKDYVEKKGGPKIIPRDGTIAAAKRQSIASAT